MKNELSYSENADLVVKILAGEASPEETEAFEKWLTAAPSNRTYFDNLKKVWEETNKLEKRHIIDLDKEWKVLERKIESKEEGMRLITDETSQRSTGFYITRVAAVLLIMVTTLFGALFISKNLGHEEIVTAMESREVMLPDGSKVTLNIQSSLKYPRRFNRGSRDVTLQGEAFFLVHTDSLLPFHIEAGDLVIEVLGTSFNVDAYKEKENAEVIVKTGKVAVSTVGNEASRILLEAGEKAALSRSDLSLSKDMNSDINFMAWKTRKLYFENYPLTQVIAVLNDVYHSNISIRGDSLTACTLTATFDKQSLEAVLNVIKSTLDLKIIQSDESIQITGSGC